MRKLPMLKPDIGKAIGPEYDVAKTIQSFLGHRVADKALVQATSSTACVATVPEKATQRTNPFFPDMGSDNHKWRACSKGNSWYQCRIGQSSSVYGLEGLGAATKTERVVRG